MYDLDFIYNRKSIRNYTNEKIPKDDILKMLDAAIHAPSPMNFQGWHFVVVENKDIIQSMANIITERHNYIASLIKNNEEKERYMNTLTYYLNFKNAPCTILVFNKECPIIELDLLKATSDKKDIELLYEIHSSEQAIGAAIENFLLAASQMGYGACYMTGPVKSKKKIEDLIHINKDGYSLAAMISLGIPSKIAEKSSPRKSLDEVGLSIFLSPYISRL